MDARQGRLVTFAFGGPGFKPRASLRNHPLSRSVYRGLRKDLRNTVATIQRVQIVLYRLQSQTEIAGKAIQRLDQARDRCRQLEMQKSFFSEQITQFEARKQNAPNESARAQAEQSVSQFQSGLEALAGQIEQCQAEQAEASDWVAIVRRWQDSGLGTCDRPAESERKRLKNISVRLAGGLLGVWCGGGGVAGVLW